MDLSELHDLMYGEPPSSAPQASGTPLLRSLIVDELTALRQAVTDCRNEVAALTALWLENPTRRRTKPAKPRFGEPPPPLTWALIPQLFDQYGDKPLIELAQSVGVTRSALGYWFRIYKDRMHRDEEYRAKLHQVFTRRAEAGAQRRAK